LYNYAKRVYKTVADVFLSLRYGQYIQYARFCPLAAPLQQWSRHCDGHGSIGFGSLWIDRGQIVRGSPPLQLHCTFTGSQSVTNNMAVERAQST